MRDHIPIPHQGGRKPDWLEGQTQIKIVETNGRQIAAHCAWHENHTYHLPANHWAAAVLRAGLTPWNPKMQGDGPPADWDGGKVMLKSGDIGFWSPNWKDCIGYAPTTPDQQAEGESGAFDRWFFSATDPKTGMPYGTTLIYRCCDNDAAKFEEACRIMRAAFDAGIAALRQAGEGVNKP